MRDRPTATAPGALSRRGLLRTTWAAAGVAVLATAGQTVPLLRKVSVFGADRRRGAVRGAGQPHGRGGHPSTDAATDPAYTPGSRLRRPAGTTLTRAGPRGPGPAHRDLPIACVEGWSANGSWTGVRLRDLLELVDAAAEVHPAGVVAASRPEPFRETVLQDDFAADDRTLLALALNGEPLLDRPRLPVPADRAQPSRRTADQVGRPAGGADVIRWLLGAVSASPSPGTAAGCCVSRQDRDQLVDAGLWLVAGVARCTTSC